MLDWPKTQPSVQNKNELSENWSFAIYNSRADKIYKVQVLLIKPVSQIQWIHFSHSTFALVCDGLLKLNLIEGIIEYRHFYSNYISKKRLKLNSNRSHRPLKYGVIRKRL